MQDFGKPGYHGLHGAAFHRLCLLADQCRQPANNTRTRIHINPKGPTMHRLALAGALALVLSSAAYADATPPAKACYTEAALAADAKAHGDVEVAGATVRADHIDEIIIQGSDSLIAWMFKDGCMVSMVGVDTVAPDHGA
jgi:hypothetical protein